MRTRLFAGLFLLIILGVGLYLYTVSSRWYGVVAQYSRGEYVIEFIGTPEWSPDKQLANHTFSRMQVRGDKAEHMRDFPIPGDCPLVLEFKGNSFPLNAVTPDIVNSIDHAWHTEWRTDSRFPEDTATQTMSNRAEGTSVNRKGQARSTLCFVFRNDQLLRFSVEFVEDKNRKHDVRIRYGEKQLLFPLTYRELVEICGVPTFRYPTNHRMAG